MRRASLLLAIWAGWAGCLCQSPVDPNGHVPGKCSNAVRIDVQKTDILFVVDDSESMKDAEYFYSFPAHFKPAGYHLAGDAILSSIERNTK